MSDGRAPKTCRGCGRTIVWRRKWARCWEQVRYCSQRCRRRRSRPIDEALEEAIVALLGECSGTLCPSEAARRVRPGPWRPLMEPARAAARRLAARSVVRVLQKGVPVDPSRAKGPIRLARGRAFPA